MSDNLFSLISENQKRYQYFLPKDDIIFFFRSLFSLLFPYSKQNFLLKDYREKRKELFDCFCLILEKLALFSKSKNNSLVDELFISLEKIYKQLLKDADVLKEFDPASYSFQEIVSSYPGFYAVAAYRIAHKIDELKIPLVPRVISEYCHSLTGIDIHPRAEIGESFFIDHGTGIVIGETTIIKNNVKIYQGVTLGAKTVFYEKNLGKRHPTIEDNVIIYSNATILGGDTIVGKNSIIGGNVWLTRSIGENSLVRNDFSELEIKKLKERND